MPWRWRSCETTSAQKSCSAHLGRDRHELRRLRWLVLTSPAAMMAGMMMGTGGLMGSHRGTWGGVAMGTAGGALVGAGIGAQFGGPMGAALGAGIGAVAGFGIGLGEKLFGVETSENQAKRLAKQLYSISIDDSMAKQIVNIAQQKYAGEVSVAVRDPDVRKMLMLYSQATGHKMPSPRPRRSRRRSRNRAGGSTSRRAT